MSNVFSNASFAVLSVMDTRNRDVSNIYLGSTVFVQRKPEEDYGNLTILSFTNGQDGLRDADFNVQERFEANVVPLIQAHFGNLEASYVNISNSAISVNSYKPDGSIIT